MSVRTTCQERIGKRQRDKDTEQEGVGVCETSRRSCYSKERECVCAEYVTLYWDGFTLRSGEQVTRVSGRDELLGLDLKTRKGS